MTAMIHVVEIRRRAGQARGSAPRGYRQEYAPLEGTALGARSGIKKPIACRLAQLLISADSPKLIELSP